MPITLDLLVLFQKELQAACIDSLPDSDPSKAGVVKIGPLQGEPEPDIARISIMIYPNDPDNLRVWKDELVEVEIPNTYYYERRFTIKFELILEFTGEDLLDAYTLASTVRDRIEHTILGLNYTGFNEPQERVVRGAMAAPSDATFDPGGGPPDQYIISGHIRFSVLTVTTLT